MLLFLHYRSVVYPTDFPRRSRPYDPSSMKAHEWRQVGLYLFPIIVRCLPASGKGHEKSVFLAFSYLNRCMRLPEEEYQHVAEDMIDEALNILSDSYEKAYGLTACTYNYHLVTAHFKHLRAHGPLTTHTAYPYESSYAEVRRSFVAGTRK